MRACALATIATLACIIVATPPLNARQGPSASNLLNKYADRHFEVVTSVEKLSKDDWPGFVRNFEKDASKWIVEAGVDAAPHRRFIAAALGLDLARRTVETENWYAGRDLVSWGCAQLRLDPQPLPAERWWHLAAVALYEGAGDRAPLVGTGRPAWAVPLASLPGSASDSSSDVVVGHLSHAEARFPDEPRFLLAEAVVEESRVWDVGSFRTTTDEAAMGVGILPGQITASYVAAVTVLAQSGGFAANGALVEIDRIRSLAALSKRFEELSKHLAILPDVDLRYGFIALRFADSEAALSHFHRVESTSQDRDLVYLARLFSGMAYERTQHVDEAIAAYRSALASAPRAESAEARLTALLARSGQPADAGIEADGFLSAAPAPDPWRLYRAGDYRLLDTYLDHLRAAIE